MKLPFRLEIVCVVSALSVAACCPRQVLAQEDHQSRTTDIRSAGASGGRAPSRAVETVVIPGPLRSFLRMAGISQQLPADGVMPMLAENVSLYGYELGRQTEYLVLLNRYVRLAREIQRLTDAHGMIEVKSCADVDQLVHVLGYKFAGVCGQKNAALVTADAERAFLTIDSGFPITDLEQTLQKHEPFTYAFPETRVPIMFTDKSWTSISTGNRRTPSDLVDALLNDQILDRLYWAFSRCDEETRSALRQAPGLARLASLAPVFDLYGSTIRIHSGTVLVPAGSERDWRALADASPNSPGEFVSRLLAKDHGWLAAYYDAIAHLNATGRAHLTENARLVDLYRAYRSTAANTDSTTGMFSRNADLLILLTSLKWNAAGEPVIPGGSALWQEVLSRKSSGLRSSISSSSCCDNSERLLKTLVAASKSDSTSGPLQIFLLLSAINAGRTERQRLGDGTDRLLAAKFSQFGRWFSVFAEFPALDDASVEAFVSVADQVEAIKTPALRSNALGAFQANIGLWRIFARQGQIPPEKQSASWLNAVQPFKQIETSTQLFDASRHSLQSMLMTVADRSDLSQDEIVELLAGPPQTSAEGGRVRGELVQRIRTVLDDQRLVSLDTLFALYDGLGEKAHGATDASRLLPLAEQLREFEMPRPIFTGGERSAWAPVVYTTRHAELQIRTDLSKVIQASATPAQLDAARGQLAPFLRDTLVGLNYAYYEPPGAEVLHHNPLFVRSHDFSSISVLGLREAWGQPVLIGVGATAGGGAYLMGSLGDLSYALASTESEFIAPKNIQALVWKEEVPQLLAGAVLPRWWQVSKDELHAANLYQRMGEELLKASASDGALQSKVFAILSDRMNPNRLEQTEAVVEDAESKDESSLLLLPSESFFLATEFRKRFPGQDAAFGKAGHELEELALRDPAAVDTDRISMDFGAPHPTLMLSNSCSIFNMKPPPLYGGLASGLFAESWESNNLYWARLADDGGYPPVMLNLLAPALTRRMVTNIFASNIDDWPALSRAMQETGAEFRDGKINVIGVTAIARQ
jgi:hypothetical protein